MSSSRHKNLLLSFTSLTLVILVCVSCTFSKPLRSVRHYPEWSEEIRQMTVADDYVFVAMGRDGLSLLDATNPAAPIKADWEVPIDAAVWTAFDDNYIYALGSYTLRVVDISDLPKPMVLGSYKPDTPTIEAAIKYPYILLTTGVGGLHIIDASDPTTLKRVGIYDATVTKSNITVWDVAVSDEHAYITLDDLTGQGFVEVLDISNPAMPLKIGSARVNLAGDIAIKDNYAFVANGHGLQILDVSNPSSPIVITSYDTPNFAQGLVVKDHYVYINDLFGVEVVDISDIHSLRRVAYKKLPQVQDVAVVDDYIYVADSFVGLVIFEHP